MYFSNIDNEHITQFIKGKPKHMKWVFCLNIKPWEVEIGKKQYSGKNKNRERQKIHIFSRQGKQYLFLLSLLDEGKVMCGLDRLWDV